MELKDFFTLSIPDFAYRSGISDGTVRAMIKDGRLEAVRVGQKKILIVVQSYFAYLEKEAAKGVAPYPGVEAAHKARKEQIAEGNRRPGKGPRGRAKDEKNEAALKEVEAMGLKL